jgi:hypothetical protein
MKCSIKGLFVILAIIMSLVAVQSVCAETMTGIITDISNNNPSNMIVLEKIDGSKVELYGMRIKWLENQHDIVLEDLLINKTTVSIDAYPVECIDGTTKFMACLITVLGGETVDLRLCPPNNLKQ